MRRKPCFLWLLVFVAAVCWLAREFGKKKQGSGGNGTTTTTADRYAHAAAAAASAYADSWRCGVGVAAAAVAVAAAAFYIYFVEMYLMTHSYFLLFNLILSPGEGSHPVSTDSYMSTCRHVGVDMSVRQCRYPL